MTGSLGDWVRVVHRVLTFFNCAELASTCLQLHPGLALMCLEKSRSSGRVGDDYAWCGTHDSRGVPIAMARAQWWHDLGTGVTRVCVRFVLEVAHIRWVPRKRKIGGA